MKRKNKIPKVRNKIFIPVLLVIFWIIFSLIFIKTINYSLLTYEDYFRKLTVPSLDRIHVGEKIKGEFMAKENNLAILLIKFYDAKSKNPNPNHILNFRIKEKKSNKWFYEHGYNIGQIEGTLMYPFGFNSIPNSKGKTYEFEIDSNTSDNDNYVSLKANATVISGYYFSKAELLHNPSILINFIEKKIIFSVISINFILRSLIFLMPLILFIFWKILTSKIAKERQVMALVTFIAIAIDILIIRENILGVVISICIAWIISIYILKIGSKISLLIGLFFVLLGFTSMILLPDLNIFKINQWSYFFLVVFAMQILFEEKYDLSKFSTPKEFIKAIFGKND